MYDVITIGAATQDVFLESDGFHVMRDTKRARSMECFPLGEKIAVARIMFATGGGATNAAATFRNLGFKAAPIVRTGDDPAGEFIRKDLAARGIPRRFVRTTRIGTSGYAAILLTPHGDRTALVHRGVSGSFSARDIPWGELRARWLFITSLNGNLPLLQRLFRTACQRNISIAFNPGVQELRTGLSEVGRYCGSAHVLIINRSEAALLSGSRELSAIRRRLDPHFRASVVVTDGARGAYYWDQTRKFFAKPFPVKVANTTGAGDAFGAGFISGILRWRDPIAALKLATLNALGTIQEMGAKRGLLDTWPSEKELRRVRVIRE